MAKPVEFNPEAILANNKLPRSVRYAMLRHEICTTIKVRKEKRDLLNRVGEYLKGELQPGNPSYWLFIDGTKAKFQE